ncbi:GntR family transcriptional regulator [Herbiconiux moechotypicola]|uniref:GntR family transcriptional regulator n=1 Tax=Herbiconiux moechotypicola TaxID=637393 RepID=A0ABN3DQA7_9MICO|nr:GntR family transcriptional regulator [Herbiconiux moechotypicola]MCS5731425.1 GntR family transcriptional regulator [Herbiconiux moechotypicola]
MDDFDSLAGSIIAPRAKVLGDQVLEQLRVLIITGKLPVGTHLVESQLSTTFDVSRGPIRDALAQLEIEGLVENRRRGVFVRGLTTHDIDELYTVREAIEVAALRLTATAPRESWDLALAPLAAMHAAAAERDHLTFAHADMAFHASFYAIADHRRLQRVWQQYEPTFAVLLELTTAEDIDLGPSYESHVEIHRQALDGEIDKATVSLQEHLLGSRSRLVSAFARSTLGDTFPEDSSRPSPQKGSPS